MTLVQTHTGEWTPADEDLTELPDDLTIHGDRDQARFLTRVEYAARLRIHRVRWDEVARRAGYADKGTACKAVLGYLRRRADETTAELREQESALLDAAAAAIMGKVEAGDPRAQDTLIRNRARYAALNGLNAPVAITLSSGTQAAMHDALAELETLVMGTVIASTDDLDPDDEPTTDA